MIKPRSKLESQSGHNSTMKKNDIIPLQWNNDVSHPMLAPFRARTKDVIPEPIQNDIVL